MNVKVSGVVLGTLVIGIVASGCGDQSGVEDAVGVAAAPSGCSQEIPSIPEGTEFVPWSSRLTVAGAPTEFAVQPVPKDGSLPAAVPHQLGGFPVVASSVAGAVTTAAFGARFAPGATQSSFLRDGGLILTLTPAQPTGSIANGMADDSDTGDRVSMSTVGSYAAAVTWADPDASGLRPHHVLWTDRSAGVDVNLAGVRSAAELVGIAREFSCH